MDEDKAEVLGLLDRIRKTVERETADPHRTYHETDPVVLLIKAEDAIENMAIRFGVIDGPRTVALGAVKEAPQQPGPSALARALVGPFADEAADPSMMAATMKWLEALRSHDWKSVGIAFQPEGSPRSGLPFIVVHGNGGVSYVGNPNEQPAWFTEQIRERRRENGGGNA